MAQFVYELLVMVFLVCLSSAQSPDAEFEIDEELPLGTMVGNIATKSSIFLEALNRKYLQFDILDSSRHPGNLFNVSVEDGNLFVAKRIDREAFCLVVENCVLTVNVLVRNTTDSKVITVNIKVRDINDNPPQFDRDSVVLKVPENNALDTVLKITGASDRDFNPQFKVKNYALDNFREVFQVNATRSLDGSSELEIRVKQSLDREAVAKYAFKITAYDGGSPPLSAFLSVTVDVTDVNDNAPVFVNSTFDVTLEGKIPLGSVVLRVSATDADEGNNALVSYDFSSLQKSFMETYFRIDSASGAITVVSPLKSGITEFIVEAQDNGIPRLKTQTVARVNVFNTGNTPPRVSITTIGGSGDQNSVSITEPAGRGYFVAFVIVEDDKIENVSCDINNEVFKMDPVANKGYKVLLQGPVDRETRDSYNLTVLCLDRGDPPYNTSTYFMVKIDDANDNAPEFTQSKYTRSIKEGKKTGEYVLQVKATDKDIGQNALVTYSIDPAFTRYFSIDANTGAMTAIGDIDRETLSVMRFNVIATDHGSPQLTGTSEIVIIVEDVNDNAPQFDQRVFKIQTVEEVGGYRVIGNVTALDPDEGANSQLEYFFTGSLDGADGVFTVLLNGSITSSTKLDREERANYSFSVMVRDKGVPPLSSTASVVIEVQDINDNTPAILFPKSQNHTVLISTVPESGIVLSRIIAYDDDAEENGSLSYAIISGNEDNAFDISESTGEFKISQASRLRNMKVYDVGIRVSDRGAPPKFSATSLRIDVQYDNATRDLLLLQAGPQKQEDYIIIVAVVAAVTVIVSTLIVVAICVVFQKDRASRTKPGPKGSFHNLQSVTSVVVAVEEKVHTTEPTEVVSPHQGGHPLNNLSSPPSKDVKFSLEETQWSSSDHYHVAPKGKAVSFNLDNADKTTTPSAGGSPPLTFSTFGPPLYSRFAEGGGDLYPHQRSSMTRQTDDVTSDTSADTATSDSGRGNSVDDVNFEQIMKGELSPSFNSRGQGLDYQPPSRKQTVPERPLSHHVRYRQTADVFAAPPELPPKQKLLTHPYEGALPYPRATRSGDHPGFISSTTGGLGGSGSNLSQKMTLAPFVTPRQLSVTSIDDDASTTTSGSYVISPDDIKIETYVGADIVV